MKHDEKETHAWPLYIFFQLLERDGNPDVSCNTGPPQATDMNTYLKHMVRCLASVARPR